MNLSSHLLALSSRLLTRSLSNAGSLSWFFTGFFPLPPRLFGSWIFAAYNPFEPLPAGLLSTAGFL